LCGYGCGFCLRGGGFLGWRGRRGRKGGGGIKVNGLVGMFLGKEIEIENA